MASARITQNFTKGVNLDLDELRLPQDVAKFMKNLTADVNQNPGASQKSGANAGVWTPREGNTLISLPLPPGDNTNVGSYLSEQTNELYLFLYNSTLQHSIWVLYGDTGGYDKVWQGSDLPFSLQSEYFIAQGRCTLTLKSYIDPVTGLETNFKFLTFTNNLVQQYTISVADAIATASYSTPYFDGGGVFYDRLTLINLGVPTPVSCIGVEEVPVEEGDIDKQNLIARNGFQFRAKFIDVFGRESIHGVISNAWVSIVGGGCISSGALSPRCLSLTFDAGNPLVNYIQIEYRKWVGNDRAGALQTDWIKYDTICKWVNVPGQQWYERAPNTDYYNDVTNVISYTFCADRNCEPIDVAETDLVEPGIPRLSSSVFSPNKRIGLVNNVRGFEPIDPAQLAKIDVFPSIPEEGPCEAPLFRNIKVYANIYRIYEDNGVSTPFDVTGIIRKSFDKYVWGDEDGDCSGVTANSFKMDQVFGDQENPGFIFYLAGTAYYAIARWGSLDLTSQVFTYNPTFASPDPIYGIPMCEINFTVPAGKYVLRGASHKATIYDTDYQQTSTYIGGWITLGAAYAVFDRRNYAQNPVKELVIDCSAGDVIYNNTDDPMFVILDTTGTDSACIDGYLYEQENGNTPIEMNPVYFQRPGDDKAFGSFFTDHNGFFFGFADGGNVTIQIATDLCASGYTFITRSNLQNRVIHGYGGGVGSECEGSGNWKNRVYVSNLGGPNYPFPEEARRVIEQSVLKCDSEIGVPAVPIVMTKGAVGLTDITGKAIIIAHNRYDYLSVPWTLIPPGLYPFLSDLVPDYSTAPGSADDLIFIRFGACKIFVCDTCDSLLPSVPVGYVECLLDRVTVMADYFVSLYPYGARGVQTGGRYGVAICLLDDIGRRTFFQARAGEDGFVAMPNQNDTTTSPYPSQLLASIGYTIDPTFQVPSVFKKMIFGVTENTVFSDFLSWSADYIQFVDNTGQTNAVNPTMMRVYYGSLNEYKKLNNNTVNCSWQFISDPETGSSVVGDIVQFLMNGDGAWLPPGLSGEVSYDSSGLFFTLPFQEEFRSFTNGLLFRVIRPKACQTNYLYYEQCMVIDLVNGMVPEASQVGVLPYFDSYLLGRLVPVPVLQGQPGALPPGGTPPNTIEYTSTNLNTSLAASGYATNNSNNNNQVLVMSVNDAMTSLPFYFESPSPSDFWGSHLYSRGRIGVLNPFEAQRRIGTEVALSATTDDRSNLNGMSWFNDLTNVYEFDRNTWGNITVALIEVGKVLFICESDHFMSSFNQTQLVAAAAGEVSAFNQYGPFTAPHRPSGTPYGCTPFNINTIQKYNGIVVWLDTEGRLIQSNFSSSRDLSTTDESKGTIGGYSGWLMNKVSEVNIQNLTPGNNTYFLGGIDPRSNEYFLTSFQSSNGGPLFARSYINNLDEPSLSVNETIVVDLISGMLKGSPSYTPEGYAMFPSYCYGRNMFSLLAGQPYRHHQGSAPGTPPPYANYYGIQCPCYIVPVANPSAELVKRYLWIEIYIKQTQPQVPGSLSQPMMYIPSVLTEKGQQSRLLISQFDIRDDFQAAAYLCDMNTPPDPNAIPATTINSIIDGNALMGRWLRNVIKTADSWNGSYFELSSIVTGLNGIKISGDSQ